MMIKVISLKRVLLVKDLAVEMVKVAAEVAVAASLKVKATGQILEKMLAQIRLNIGRALFAFVLPVNASGARTRKRENTFLSLNLQSMLKMEL